MFSAARSLTALPRISAGPQFPVPYTPKLAASISPRRKAQRQHQDEMPPGGPWPRQAGRPASAPACTPAPDRSRYPPGLPARSPPAQSTGLARRSRSPAPRCHRNGSAHPPTASSTRRTWPLVKCLWSAGRLDRVPGGLCRVLPPRRGGPLEGAVRKLIDLPPRVLLEPVVMAALRTAITQTGSAARLVRDVVLVITLGSRPAAGRPGTRRVPYLGQVPELDPGIMAPGLEPVVAVFGGDGVERDDQVRLPGCSGGQPPAPVSARRPRLTRAGEGEPRARLGPGSARRIASVR